MVSEAQHKGPVCKGCWTIGNNCKICERCVATKPTNPRPPMTEITPEALEALNQRSLEAQQTYRACSGLSDLATMIDAHNAFGSALIDLYRTGQLIHAQPSGDVVEAVARAILLAHCEDMNSPGTDNQEQVDNEWVDWKTEATAAITAYEAVSGVAKMRDKVMSLAKGEIVGMTPGPKATEETMHGFRSGWSSAMGLIRAALGEKP